MNKKVTAIASIALLSTSLAACNANNGAMDEGNNANRGNGNAQPIGYYTDENTTRDNEGPVTELLDGRNNAANQQGNRNAATRDNQGTTGNNQPTKVNQGNQGRTPNGTQGNNLGNNSMRQVNNANNGQNNQTTQQGNQNNASGNNRYADMNYHGHLNTEGYYGREERELSERVRKTVEKMKNVEDAHVVVTDNNILVAVDTNDKNDKAMRESITKELSNVASGRNVQVVTDEGTVSRVRNINNNINNGGERGTIDTDINNLMNDLGDAIRRPFTGNR